MDALKATGISFFFAFRFSQKIEKTTIERKKSYTYTFPSILKNISKAK